MLSHLILRLACYAAPISSELGGLRVCHPSSSFPSAEPREVGDRRSEGRGLRSSFAWPRVRLRRSGAARSPTIVRTRAGFTGYTYSSSRDMMPHLRTRYVHRERNRRVTRTTVAPAAWVLAPARTLEYAAPGLRHTGGFVPGGAGHACGRIRLCLPGGARRAFASLALRALARSGLPSAASMLATPEYSGSDGPSFRNDADNEEDGTGDAFDVIAIVALWVLLLGDGGLLLALRGVPAKLFSMCFLALERPG